MDYYFQLNSGCSMPKPDRLSKFFDSADRVVFRSFFTLSGLMTFLKLVFGVDLPGLIHFLVRKWLGF